ncbi:MAG: ERCC4 domain-containing protein [Candidatus Bathyarchaeia archaeon]
MCVDSNEASQRRDILNYLRLSGVHVDVQKLTVCDYVVSDRVGVERKDVSDFLGSVKDGRLFSQAKAMAEAYERPVLILEGQVSRALRRSAMKPASVYGALSSVALDYGIAIIPTEDTDSTALLLQRLAYREQTTDNRVIQLRSVDRSLPLNKQQLFLLSGFPQIGVASAEDLLEKFDTPLRVIEELASAEVHISPSGKTKKLTGALTEVKGIGPTIVEYAQTLLKSSYSQACSENPD